MYRFFLSIVCSLAMLSPAFAQITAPKEVEPFDPIIVTCELKDSPTTDIQVTWRASSEKVKFETLNEGGLLHVWAPPGDHWLEATIATQTFREMLVLVPDPANPTDLSKAKAEKVKIALSFTINRHTANFKVKGNLPTPGPAPVPVDVPTADLQSLLSPVKAIVAKGDPVKAAVWAAAWNDFLFVLQGSSPPKTVGEFKAALNAFMNGAAAKAGLQGAFLGFSAELEKAFVAHFGAEDGIHDVTKSNKFVAAIVWACQPTK